MTYTVVIFKKKCSFHSFSATDH